MPLGRSRLPISFTASIYVIVYRVLDASEAKATIEDGPAIFLVSLPESWILMELSQDLIEGRHRMVRWKVLQLILYGFTCELLVLLELPILRIEVIKLILDIVFKVCLRWHLELT